MAVGLIGNGALGSTIANALRSGHVPGAHLVDVLTKSSRALRPDATERLVAAADIVVECAGHAAVAEYGPLVLDAEGTFLVASVGALADRDLFERLTRARRGRLLLSGGAVGGIDMLRALALAGVVDDVQLTSTKPAAAFPTTRIRDDQTTLVFDGPARVAAQRFPHSANVAAAVALAIGDWEAVRVRIYADPQTNSIAHVLEIRSSTGSCRFESRSATASGRPSSSRSAPYAIVRALEREVQSTAVLV